MTFFIKLFVFSFLFFFYTIHQVEGQVLTCQRDEAGGVRVPCGQGDEDGLLDGILGELRQLENLLEENFGLDLGKGFVEAHAITNLAVTPAIGNGDFTFFSAGYQIGAGIRQNKIDTVEADDGNASLKGLNGNGIMIAGLGYFGFNVGNVWSYFGLSNEYLSRLQLYLGFFEYKHRLNELSDYQDINYKANTTYLGLRYLLIRPRGNAYLAKWLGLSTRIAVLTSKTNLDLESKDGVGRYEIDVLGNTFLWDDNSEIRMKSKMASEILELHTGVRLLGFLTLNLGYGTSKHRGESEISFKHENYLSRNGELLNAFLSVNFSQKSSLSSHSIDYQRLGLGLNFPFFRIGGEYFLINKESKVIAINARVDI